MTRLLIIGLAACGRVGFEGSPDGGVDGELADAAPDSALLPVCDRLGAAVTFCTDFEGGALGGADNEGGDPDPGGGFGGTDGWVFRAPPGTNAFLRIDAPMAAGELFIAGRMRYEGTEPLADYVVVAQAVSPQFEKISFDAARSDRIQVVSTVDGMGVGQQGVDGSLPRDRWFCWELALDVASSGGGATGFVDGAVVAAISNLRTLPANGFFAFEVGALASTDNLIPAVLHVDNLIVSTAPIGCP